MENKNIKKFLLVLMLFMIIVLSGCEGIEKAYKDTFNEDTKNFKQMPSEYEVFLEIKEKTGMDFNYKEQQLIMEILESSNDYVKYLEMENMDRLIIDTKTQMRDKNLLSHKEVLNNAQNMLREMLPDENLLIYRRHMFFEENRIRVPIIDPKNRENADWYYYEFSDNKWHKDEPIKIYDDTPLVDHSIPFDEISFQDVNRVFEILEEKSKDIEGAEPITNITLTTYTNDYFWTSTISGARYDFYLEAEHKGEIIKFERR